MITNIVEGFKARLITLNLFSELTGLVKPVPYKDQTLPFSCELSLDECKQGTEITPSLKNKIVGFFIQNGEIEEVKDDFCKSSLYEVNVSFICWFNCDSVSVQNNGNELNCCDKKGYLEAYLIDRLKGAAFDPDIFSFSELQLIKLKDYEFSGFKFNDRFKHHPYYAFEAVLPVRFIINDKCATGVNITVNQEEC